MKIGQQPAHPVQYGSVTQPGLTKREYFAAMALQGLLQHPVHADALPLYTNLAVRAADALLAELEKPNV